MNFVCANIDATSQVRMLPSVMFSPESAQYVETMAEICSIHDDSLAIVILNCIAATLEFSYVLRANSVNREMQTNLYNVIVARSSYGKSELTKLLRDTLTTIAIHRPAKFFPSKQSAIGDEVNPTLDEMSKAGLMSALDGSTRTLVCDEADMTFADVGIFLASNSTRTSPEMNCLVSTLFDRTKHTYIRQLSNRTVSVKWSKLNILGCSTGELLHNIIVRMKSGALFDPVTGRFLFWPLDGPVIPDKLSYPQLDNTRYPSLNQYVVILSFMENIIFKFDDDAIREVISWGNECKQRSRDERNNNECYSARLGKITQHVYRFCAFLQTAEIGFGIAQEYQQIHQSFPANDTIVTDFSDSPLPFRISKNVSLQAIDVISGNMHQFSLLFNSRNAPQISLLHRQPVIVSSEQQPIPSNDQDTAKAKKELKRRQRRISKFNKLAADVILYPSVCFTLTQLHKSSFIHNAGGGGLLKEVVKKLLQSDVLIICPRGIKHAKKTTPVYIKRLPLPEDMENDDELELVLTEYKRKKKSISIELYRESCQSFVLKTDGSIHSDVYNILQRPEYASCEFYALFNMLDVDAIESQQLVDNNNVVNDSNEQNYAPEHNLQVPLDDVNMLDLLSTYTSQPDNSSVPTNTNERNHLFANINLDDNDLDNAFDDIEIDHEEEAQNCSNLLITQQDQDNHLNILVADHQTLSNGLEQNFIVEKEKPVRSNNSFSSPPALRTRSKLKKKISTEPKDICHDAIKPKNKKRKIKKPNARAKMSIVPKQD